MVANFASVQQGDAISVMGFSIGWRFVRKRAGLKVSGGEVLVAPRLGASANFSRQTLHGVITRKGQLQADGVKDSLSP